MTTNAAVLGESSADPEKRLWQAVIVTAIREWVSGTLRSQRKAEEYLFQDQRDFPAVCQSAGLDADLLRSKLNRLRLRRDPFFGVSPSAAAYGTNLVVRSTPD
jgi:hypothetical protein